MQHVVHHVYDGSYAGGDQQPQDRRRAHAREVEAEHGIGPRGPQLARQFANVAGQHERPRPAVLERRPAGSDAVEFAVDDRRAVRPAIAALIVHRVAGGQNLHLMSRRLQPAGDLRRAQLVAADETGQVDVAEDSGCAWRHQSHHGQKPGADHGRAVKPIDGRVHLGRVRRLGDGRRPAHATWPPARPWSWNTRQPGNTASSGRQAASLTSVGAPLASASSRCQAQKLRLVGVVPGVIDMGGRLHHSAGAVQQGADRLVLKCVVKRHVPALGTRPQEVEVGGVVMLADDGQAHARGKRADRALMSLCGAGYGRRRPRAACRAPAHPVAAGGAIPCPPARVSRAPRSADLQRR